MKYAVQVNSCSGFTITDIAGIINLTSSPEVWIKVVSAGH